jgi:hypothetical protein
MTTSGATSLDDTQVSLLGSALLRQRSWVFCCWPRRPAAAANPLPQSRGGARDQRKGHAGEYGRQDVGDEPVEDTAAARIIVVKDKRADRPGQGQGRPHEQPVHRCAGPVLAGLATRRTRSGSVAC